MNSIKDNSIIIVPSHLKGNTLLNFNSVLKNIKVMTLSEFIKNYQFDYDLQAIHYVMQKYNIKYDLACIYLKNLYYIENKRYNNKKLDKLVEIKNDLEEKQFLKYNPLFKNKLKNYNLIFYGFSDLDKYIEGLKKELNRITPTSIVPLETNNNYNHCIYECDRIDTELEFIASQICTSIKEGISPQNIVVLQPNDEYRIPLHRIFDIYNIPLNEEPTPLLATKIGNFFIDNASNDLDQVLNLVKENFDLDNINNLEIYNQIIKICNDFYWINNLLEVKDLLVEEFKKITVNKKVYNNSIAINTLENYIPNDENYVYLVGFNQGIVPIVEKDEDYLDDKIRELLNLNSSVEKNIIHSIKNVNTIKNTKNMWITYRKSGNNVCGEVSSLNEKLNYTVERVEKEDYQHSNLQNKLKLAMYLDDYYKYGIKNSHLNYLLYNYRQQDYKNYDNKFTGIDKKYDQITLSYTSIDNYYKCAFKYYVNSILKLNIYEQNFMNYIGSLFHFVLSKKDELNFEDAYKTFLDQNPIEMNYKEKYFLAKLKEDLKFILDTVLNQSEYTNFNKSLYEQDIEITKGKNRFVGIVDKILFNNDMNMAAIIDYKTGNPSLDLKYIESGLGLQLPIYLYLLNKSNPNTEVIGFYLQKILPTVITKDYTKDLASQKRNLLKLQGYSLADLDKLNEFDKTYMDSELIKGMKVGNNGFYAYTKTLTKKNMDKIIAIIDEKIDSAFNDIENNEFTINPKIVEGKNVSCEFCSFRDICYFQEKDIERIEKVENLDFLGGDDNA